MPRAKIPSRVRIAKLAGEQRYLARSRSVEPGSYYELTVSPWGHIRCTCPGFSYRGRCAHADALGDRLARQREQTRREADALFSQIQRNHS
jgi:hypothetical protein